MTNSYTLTDMLKEATNAGASGAFVACLATTQPLTDEFRDGRHLPRTKVRSLLERGWFEEPRGFENPPFGGFMTELWNGDTERAWARADASNSALMRAAGVAPE